MNKPIALFDLDGTLADFDGAMKAGLALIAHPDELKDGTYCVFEHKDEPDHIRIRRRLLKQRPGFWRNLQKLELGMKLMHASIALGYQVNILTKAPRTNFPAWTEKVEWCHQNLPMEHGIQVNLVENKGIVYGKVLVDDWPEYVSAWIAHRPRGLVLMPAQPWNENFKAPNVIRVDKYSMNEALAALETKYEESMKVMED